MKIKIKKLMIKIVTLIMPLALTLTLFKALARRPLRLQQGKPARGYAADWSLWVYWLRRIVWKVVAIKAKHESFLLEWYEGVKVILYPGEAFSNGLFCTGHYEPNEFWFLKNHLKPGMVFVDIGANMGYYTLFAAHLIGQKGRVMAFEPSDREIKKLIKNIEINRMTNVKVYNCALSNCSSECDFLISDEKNMGLNTFANASTRLSVSNIGVQKVKTEPLDTIVQREALGRVDMLKIDVQGAEMLVLEGAREIIRQSKPIILIEIEDEWLSQQGSTGEDILRYLMDMDYDLFKFDDRSGALVGLDVKSTDLSQNIVAIAGAR